MIAENKRFDPFLPLITVSIMVYGLLVLRSAVLGNPGNPTLVVKQLFWDILGLIVMFIILSIREKFIEDSGPMIYLVVTLLLIVVLVLPVHFRAKRWLTLGPFSFQPSELSKLALVVLLPRVLLETKFGFVISLSLTLLHSFLVALEPDLGTAVMLVFIWFSVVVASRVKLRYVLVVLLILILTVPIVYFFALKDYQRQRIIAFFNPQEHSRGAAYNVIQSIHAIGSGGLLGRGYMSGPANLFGFVPVDHTDFIVAVIGEELGFMGVSLLILMYSALMFRITFIYDRIEDDYWKLVVVGVGSVVFFHVTENLLMCVGWAPVTGIPLPLISYGGSSVLVFGALLGLVLKGYAVSEPKRV